MPYFFHLHMWQSQTRMSHWTVFGQFSTHWCMCIQTRAAVCIFSIRLIVFFGNHIPPGNLWFIFIMEERFVIVAFCSARCRRSLTLLPKASLSFAVSQQLEDRSLPPQTPRSHTRVRFLLHSPIKLPQFLVCQSLLQKCCDPWIQWKAYTSFVNPE